MKRKPRSKKRQKRKLRKNQSRKAEGFMDLFKCFGGKKSRVACDAFAREGALNEAREYGAEAERNAWGQYWRLREERERRLQAEALARAWQSRYVQAPVARPVSPGGVRLRFAEGMRERGKNCTRKRRKKRRKRKKSGRGPALRLVKQSIQRSKTRKLNKLIKKIRRRAPSRSKKTRKLIPSTFALYGPEDHYPRPVGRPNPWSIRKIKKKKRKKKRSK